MAETCKAIHSKNRAGLHLLITWALWWVVPIIQSQMQVKIQRNSVSMILMKHAKVKHFLRKLGSSLD